MGARNRYPSTLVHQHAEQGGALDNRNTSPLRLDQLGVVRAQGRCNNHACGIAEIRGIVAYS